MNDKRIKNNELKDVVEKSLEEIGLELVVIEFKKKHGSLILDISIDRSDGVDINTCVEASNHLSLALDKQNLIDANYNLEVSSPGIERPLVRVKDYIRFVGKKIKLKTKESLDGQRNFIGVIKKADDNDFLLIADDKEIKIEYQNIAKANLVAELNF